MSIRPARMRSSSWHTLRMWWKARVWRRHLNPEGLRTRLRAWRSGDAKCQRAPKRLPLILLRLRPGHVRQPDRHQARAGNRHERLAFGIRAGVAAGRLAVAGMLPADVGLRQRFALE